MSSHLALEPQIWNCLVPPGKFQALEFNYFVFVNFQEKLTGTSWSLCACEASLFGLLCAWRKVQILRQQRMMSLSLSGRGRWDLALKLLVGVVVPTHLQHLVNPRDKVIAPVQSKLTNPMITMMTMRTPLWTPSHPSSFGHPFLLVRLLKWALSRWWTTQGGHTTCTRRGIPIPLFGKKNLMRTSTFGLSLMRIGMSPLSLARIT
jgi:hypothetical protein